MDTQELYCLTCGSFWSDDEPCCGLPKKGNERDLELKELKPLIDTAIRCQRRSLAKYLEETPRALWNDTDKQAVKELEKSYANYLRRQERKRK